MSRITIFIAVILAAVGAEKAFELPIAKLTLRAIDEAGKPIAGAGVYMSFEGAVARFGGGDIVPVNGLTNENGEFSGEGHSSGTRGGRIAKNGYYTSFAEEYKFDRSVAGKWLPWNPTVEVVIKRKVNPIPMYARKFGNRGKGLEIPDLHEAVGFDLAESDWVKPYGKGKNPDFLFAVEKRGTGWNDFDSKLTVTFPNAGDGFVSVDTPPPEKVAYSSELKLPREAPENGYIAKVEKNLGHVSGSPEYTNILNNRSYFFRVRTVLDGSGKVVSALYGKTQGDFQMDPINFKTCLLQFTYYLNPNVNDRNMEFDPGKNLLSNIPETDRVTAP